MTGMFIMLCIVAVILLVQVAVLNIRLSDHEREHAEIVESNSRVLWERMAQIENHSAGHDDEIKWAKSRILEIEKANTNIRHDLQVALDSDADMMKLITAMQKDIKAK